MEKFAGKYELVKHENFVEQLVAIGIPKERISPLDKQPLDITVDGDKITLTFPKYSSSLVLNQEVEEQRPKGAIKTFTKQDGDSLIAVSKHSDGTTTTKVHTLSGTELILKQTDSRPNIPESTRVFKRV